MRVALLVGFNSSVTTKIKGRFSMLFGSRTLRCFGLTQDELACFADAAATFERENNHKVGLFLSNVLHKEDLNRLRALWARNAPSIEFAPIYATCDEDLRIQIRKGFGDDSEDNDVDWNHFGDRFANWGILCAQTFGESFRATWIQMGLDERPWQDGIMSETRFRKELPKHLVTSKLIGLSQRHSHLVYTPRGAIGNVPASVSRRYVDVFESSHAVDALVKLKCALLKEM